MTTPPPTVTVLESFQVAAGQSLQSAPLEWQTDPDWVAVIVFVPNEHVDLTS